ncbi:MAG: tetratricopeptide repeat protein, partial [Armatimonadetes bacterium]|nr:tetratricopeptide repeat protein [Armatimonadota bacterium]
MRNAFFTGRGDELAALHNALNNGGTAAVTQAVSGLGGIGKTALAVEYAHKYVDKYDHRLFCSADSPASLSAGFRAIAEELMLPIPADAKDDDFTNAVKRWLETTPRYLLILDNADFGDNLTPRQLKRFLPGTPKGHVLITTRAQTLHGSLNIPANQVMTLSVMDKDEAVTFLTERVRGKGETLTTDEADAARELAHDLGYLALALEQAAAYIAQPGRTFRNYLNLYRKRSVAQVEKATPETGDYEKTVATTWQISIEEVERVCPASVALLTLSAYLTPDDIPVEIVYAAAQGFIPKLTSFFIGVTNNDEAMERYNDLLEPLTRYSLVVPDRDTFSYSIHRLVQAVIRCEEDYEAQLQQKNTAIRVVNQAFPAPTFDRWLTCHRLLSCALQMYEYSDVKGLRTGDTGLLLSNLAHYFREQGQYVQAEIFCRKSLVIFEEVLAVPNCIMASCITNLALICKIKSEYPQAEKLYKKGLEIQQNIQPTPFADVSVTLNN